MIRLSIVLFCAVCWSSVVLAEEANGTPTLILDTPTATNVNYNAVETETVTVFESRMFPGFRPCRPEDYRKQDNDPIACQDEDVARMLSTRDPKDRKSVV